MTDDGTDAVGELLLTDREVVIVLSLMDGYVNPADVPKVFSSVGSVRITPERVRQIRSKLLGRLRGAAGRGRYGEALRKKED